MVARLGSDWRGQRRWRRITIEDGGGWIWRLETEEADQRDENGAVSGHGWVSSKSK